MGILKLSIKMLFLPLRRHKRVTKEQNIGEMNVKVWQNDLFKHIDNYNEWK
jgi:hypothetical protein